MDKNTRSLRVLGRLRLSRTTDESTSLERQRETIQHWADIQGHTVVGWAEDPDISGALDAFDTPELGDWLNNRHHEFDVLAAWKLDRLGRNAIQLNKLFGWIIENDKTLFSSSESLDLSNWAGRMLANVIAGLAEGELEAIRERQRGSRQKLRNDARWPGGKPPFGYTAVKREDGQGWGLEIDPVASELVRRIVDAVLNGRSYSGIASELNSEGVLTPSQYYRAKQAGYPVLTRAEVPELVDIDPKPSKNRKRGIRTVNPWTQTPVRNLLRSHALRGYVHHEGSIVRDDNGMPVQIAEPLVTPDEWELLQGIMDKRQQNRRSRRDVTASPLAGVVHCGECGLPLSHTLKVARGIEYRYYRCEAKDTNVMRADFVESLVEELVLDTVGDLEILERVWIPGDSKESELREAIAGLDQLSAMLGKVSSATAVQRLESQISALDTRIVELESAPSAQARYEYRATGGTYRGTWDSSDTNGRRDLLKRSGISVRISLTGIEGKRSGAKPGTVRYVIRFPEELKHNLGHPEGEDHWEEVSGEFPSVFQRRSADEITERA